MSYQVHPQLAYFFAALSYISPLIAVMSYQVHLPQLAYFAVFTFGLSAP